MSLFDSLVDLIETPVRCVGEIGKDLSSLKDIKKDEADGMLALGTLWLSSFVKGVVKSLEKAGEDLDK